ncbi:HEAT repeat domain-containing protein [Stigmatella sp. ncwal1]|uniref:HEAT repeat domain-containing protein n=1 Tax=Stigmatella ashevillensis TaxID=2995309 RepID=A0ABT5D708_9BACT|nr:HEAT repeat domain-containing protein [Stigmatella ashevillena]MDC0709341.1 HEAT repeat domain-containing protein [Stigmatella ashevillena]
MSSALLVLLLLSAGPRGSTGATDCWMSCQQHVQDAALRATICQSCITQGSAEGWVVALGHLRPVPREVLRSALTDSRWQVRWAALRVTAKARGLSEPRALAEWVAGAQGEAELTACLTAIRIAAEAGRLPAPYFQGAGDKGAVAVEKIRARKDALREALELELYAEDAAVRQQALSQLSVFLGMPPARVVLDAMEGRSPTADAAVASALKAVAERGESSVGRMLLEAASPDDPARVNRLFALYSQEIQGLQGELTASDPVKRRSAVSALRVYGPLAQRELEQALNDPDRLVRQSAARGVARAEGFSLLEAAGRRLRAPASLGAQLPWLEAVAREKDCQPALLAVADDSQHAPVIRGEALALLAECDVRGQARLERLSPFLRDAEALVRAGALRAFGAAAGGAELTGALTAALEDPSPEVIAAAIDTAALRRQAKWADVIAEQLLSGPPLVRQAAASALERLGRPHHIKALAECLRQDTVAAIRVSAAQALGGLGGPFAVSALSEAVQKDADTHVQHVSREALRRLGFKPR